MPSFSPLFVYGTLRDARKRRAILRRAVETMPARLDGYQYRAGKWPYLVRSRGGAVAGLLLYGLGTEDFARLDAYEDIHLRRPLYRRVRRKAVCRGRKISCWLYLPVLKHWPENWR